MSRNNLLRQSDEERRRARFAAQLIRLAVSVWLVMLAAVAACVLSWAWPAGQVWP